MPSNPALQCRRVGLLGGAFDPPHDGHLRLAQLAWENLMLDELRLVPANIAPQKCQPTAPVELRLEMLKGMLEGSPYTIDCIELELGSVSFTANTLETLCKREPDSAWILIMGSDQAVAFETWRNSARILELASVSIAPRPNSECDAQAAFELPVFLSERLSQKWSGLPGQVILLPGTKMNLASSQIRKSLAQNNRAIGLSGQVETTILRERLYRCISVLNSKS